MSRISAPFSAHFLYLTVGCAAYSVCIMRTPIHSSLEQVPSPLRQPSRLDSWGVDAGQLWSAVCSGLIWLLVCGGAALFAQRAHAQQLTADANELRHRVEGLVASSKVESVGNNGAKGFQVEVVLGELDHRLKLAPCEKTEAYLPTGMRLWGQTRVGLRCVQGPVRWNVFWPVTVKVWGQAVVPVVALRPGEPINQGDVAMARVDLAASSSPAVTDMASVVGRMVSRSVQVGQSLRESDVKARRWFSVGDIVSLTVKGQGFSVVSEGTALTPGDEGQCARIRVENGRTVCGEPVGERRVEIVL